jgi:cytochrome c-type biogenesis protein CcmF
MLGALWSFAELGWGGYWGWDPVENASLLPWLVGTAYLHSIQVEEKRGMLRVWNVSLVMGAFVLALLGTFLVRSGILESIHAFGASTLGKPFLGFIAFVAIGSVVLVVSRLDHLKSEGRIDNFFSREGAFLLNNLVLVGLAFVVWWGTFFPLISEALTGKKASVGPPWFDRYTVPLALVLVLLAGIGPVLTWRKVSPRLLRRTLAIPLGITAAAVVLMVAFTNATDSWPSLAMFSFITFVLAVVGQEYWRGVGARRTMTGERPPAALARLVSRNRRRWGGYIVHAGIAVLFLGVAASSAFHSQKDVHLNPGETTKVGGYNVTYIRPTAVVGQDRANTGAPISLGAVLDVEKDGKHRRIHPARNFYPTNDASLPPVARFFMGEATSEVDVRWGLSRDLWFAVQPDLARLMPAIREADKRFAGVSPELQARLITAIAESYAKDPPAANFRMIVSPMVSFIWIGGLIAVFGALTALWPGTGDPRRRAVSSVYAARLARELSRA